MYIKILILLRLLKVIEIFSMVAAQKISIKLETPEKLIVHGDIDMVKTVVRNLLSNAIKFSNQKSEILVVVTDKEEFSVLSVKDYGCGIDSEGTKKLLHTDTHFSTFGTNNEEGSGLGLLLCKRFCSKTVEIYGLNQKKEKGSTFSFSIPLKNKHKIARHLIGLFYYLHKVLKSQYSTKINVFGFE